MPERRTAILLVGAALLAIVAIAILIGLGPERLPTMDAGHQIFQEIGPAGRMDRPFPLALLFLDLGEYTGRQNGRLRAWPLLPETGPPIAIADLADQIGILEEKADAGRREGLAVPRMVALAV